MSDAEWENVKLSYDRPFRSEINKARTRLKAATQGGVGGAKWAAKSGMDLRVPMSKIKLEGDNLVIDGRSFDTRRPLNNSSTLPTPALKQLVELDPFISEADRPAYLDLMQELENRRVQHRQRGFHPSLLGEDGELSPQALRTVATQVGFALKKYADRLGGWVWALRGQAVTDALMAARNWKPEGGAQLKTYLQKAINGAILKQTNPNLNQLPKELRPLLNKHYAEIMNPQGLTDQELATSLNTTPEAIRQVRDYLALARPQNMTQTTNEGEEFDNKGVN